MKTVEIRTRRTQDGAMEPLGRVSVPRPGGPAVAVGVDAESQTYLERLLSRGVQSDDGAMLHSEDGERFVAALPEAIRGSRLWATRVYPAPKR